VGAGTGSASRAEGPYGRGRSTGQRRAVVAAAEAMAGAFTADDLVARVRLVAPGVSTATVYRSISALTDSGFLAPVGQRDGAALYTHCAKAGHHHHVVCTGCGATAHAPCPVDVADAQASAPDGFVVTGHEVRFYGLCAACVEREGRGAGCSCDAAPASPAGEA